MKKLHKALIACLAAGGLLLAVSVSAFAQTGGSGYQAFKDAVVNTFVAHNETISADFMVTDNGLQAASGTTEWKFDGQMRLQHTTIQSHGILREYGSGGESESGPTSANSGAMMLAKALADTLAGDVKNEFVSDGGNISLDLQGDQIPQLARLAVAAAAEHLREGLPGASESRGADGAAAAVFNAFPSLTGTDVQSLRMAADISGGYVSADKLELVLTGADEKGEAHTIGITVDAHISQVGNTCL